jgi:photosystem II stability/assembly factor-like uncharacterized protein
LTGKSSGRIPPQEAFWKKRERKMTIVKQFEQTSYYLKDVGFINDAVGWAVGDPHWDQVSKTYTATIIKTSDGGETWTAQNANDIDFLQGVDFVDAVNGWAVGDNGTILHTSNGGNSWTQQTVGTTDEFTNVVFVDANQGWATTTNPIHYDWGPGYPDNWEASIWHTSNGGQTWVEQTIPNNASILKDVEFVDSQTGWAVGVKYLGDGQWGDPLHQPVVYYTDDGGLTWQEQYSSELA